jgi:hypothetical protein
VQPSLSVHPTQRTIVTRAPAAAHTLPCGAAPSSGGWEKRARTPPAAAERRERGRLVRALLQQGPTSSQWRLARAGAER